MADVDSNPALAVGFRLSIDGSQLDPSIVGSNRKLDIGLWTSFDGLGIQTGIEKKLEGGDNFLEHKLPTRITYTDVKLGRPINKDSGKVAKWFQAMGTQVTRTTAVITAIDTEGKEIVSWQLFGVVPVSWTGPSFSVEQAKVATETLTLAYETLWEPAQPSGSSGGGPIGAVN